MAFAFKLLLKALAQSRGAAVGIVSPPFRFRIVLDESRCPGPVAVGSAVRSNVVTALDCSDRELLCHAICRVVAAILRSMCGHWDTEVALLNERALFAPVSKPSVGVPGVFEAPTGCWAYDGQGYLH